MLSCAGPFCLFFCLTTEDFSDYFKIYKLLFFFYSLQGVFGWQPD